MILKPLSVISQFLKNSASFIDMRWVLNDTFLVILVSSSQNNFEIFVFDPLLEIYPIDNQ